MSRLSRLVSSRPLRAATLAIAAVAATSLSAPSARAGLLDAMVGPSDVPACGDTGVVETIREKFVHMDANVLHRGLAIQQVDRIRQSHFGNLNSGPVLRRYCYAHAYLNDGPRPKTLYYLIEQNYGFLGLSWNVEFCVQGYDRWRVQDGNCRAVRHWW
ncbi:hypothetical protein [Prosthecomicrobium hirschii]|uniref:Cytoplasmic protein n=1 Tax=Prosthecodimorpha hirschii TaxID=665126 RepID=A0A0P6WD87_9HYPH|nr:hypothetical protein [Prosthecomicrobium hirschii]KPL54460.1 hypothetical protein ABB55_21420 [Prosthecomicrobium hirschii]MCW1840694.1 hypothetical protein [Prosthecomicrobium hirschii]TPQ49716.1 hypothetical protein C2U72_17085 [Prosthecomicrobium hirschii]